MSAPSALIVAEELLTEPEAVRSIPGRDSDVREWLRGLGIARRGPTGIRVYRWSEVVAAMPLEAAPVPAPAQLFSPPRRNHFPLTHGCIIQRV